jgi:hypothetical protein
MFREVVTRGSTVYRLLVLTLSLSAAAGWVSFGVSSQSATEVERQLRRELGSLQEAQAKLLSEQSITRTTLSEIGQLRISLASARTEIARLSQPVRPATESSSTGAIGDTVSSTGSTTRQVAKPLVVKAVAGAQRSLQVHSGQTAVKLATPITQKETERSPRGAGQGLTPNLDTASLRQLTQSAEAQAE